MQFEVHLARLPAMLLPYFPLTGAMWLYKTIDIVVSGHLSTMHVRSCNKETVNINFNVFNVGPTGNQISVKFHNCSFSYLLESVEHFDQYKVEKNIHFFAAAEFL